MRIGSGHSARTRFRNSTPDMPGIRWSQRMMVTARVEDGERVLGARAMKTVNSSSSVLASASSERTSSSTTRTACARSRPRCRQACRRGQVRVA